MHPIIAADIVKRHGHDLAYFQTHYGAHQMGSPGQYLFLVALAALAVIFVVAASKRIFA